ncbi:MAG: class I adenylate-forming enzyme family protein [Pseudomonadota bacterium]
MPLSGPPLDHPVDIPKLLHAGLHRAPDAPSLVSDKTRTTWHDLETVSHRLAANFLALGLKPGDRIASLMPNRTALLIFYIACFKSGLVAVPLNYRYTPREIDHAIEVSDARALLSHIEREPDWLASRRIGDLSHGVITFGGKRTGLPDYLQLIKSGEAEISFPARDPQDPAAIFFTSGSTGPAKGVTHTASSIGFMLAGHIAASHLSPDDVILPGSSMSHIGGFALALAGLAAGARVVVARTFDAHTIVKLLRAERPTVMFMIPTMLLKLVHDYGVTSDDFATVRACRSGADKVPAELEAELERRTGHKIVESYGMTEVGVATQNPPEGPIKVGSVGQPIPGVSLSVRDDAGVELPTETPGQLFIKSPGLLSGYWNDPEATAAALRDGWLDSGDIMKHDTDGYLWFCGRKKQIIIHDGSNIFPQEVENALLEHPAVENAAVIGVHDLLHGENVRAYVAIRNGVERPKTEALIDHARARVGYKAPEEIVFLDEIPLNATGKIDRADLKARAAEHH